MLIHSYNQGLAWSDNVTAGFMQTLTVNGFKGELFIEYMDTKRHPWEHLFPILAELYKEKYTNASLGAVVVSDNNALNFVIKHRDDLFRDTPIVFCGINNFHLELLQGEKSVTGVIEDIDIKGTIELMLKLLPDTREIVVINDRTTTGEANQTKLEAVKPLFKGRVHFTELIDISVDKLENEISNLKNDAAVLVFTFHRDNKGTALSLDAYLKLVSGFSNRPLFGMWDHYFAYGFLGGSVISGHSQGVNAGKKAVQILNGSNADSIPLTLKSPNVSTVNYSQMKKYGVPDSRIPDYADVINRPLSFYEVNKTIVWSASMMLSLLTGAVILLVFNFIIRKQAEKNLKDSEEKYRQIVSKSTDAIMLFDSETKEFIDINPACIRTYGYSREEFLNMNYNDITPESGNSKMAIEKTTQGDIGKIPIRYHRKKDGTIFPVEISSSAFDQKGRTIVCGIARDISERLAAEEKIRRSEAILNATQSLIKTGGWEWNVDKKTMFWSDEVYRIHDLEPGIVETDSKDHVTRSIACYHPDDRLIVSDAFNKCATEGVPYDLEFPFTTVTGRKIWIRTIAQPVFENGSVHRVIGNIMDITDLKRAEEERARLQNQLQQAQKMEAVGTLAGGISHDFNNLLQAINGYCQLLLFDIKKEDPEYSNLMAIQNAGKRAAELVRQLLLFSRKAETERQPIKLNHEVEQALQILIRTIPKMIHIELRPENRLWPINADPVQIEQIILNLGVNAADAMPEGGRLLIETENTTISSEFANTHIEAEPGRYVLLSVSDTGHGMDKETVAKIFEPFFTTKEIGKGTGLGLASVYGIVKSHGGYMSCYSEIDQGTTFRIYFPAMDQLEIKDEIKTEKLPKGGRETILAVDDEEPIRDFAKQVLNKFGYSVITASSGEEALNIYYDQSQKIDLIILDIGMPGMGGLQCLKKIFAYNPSARVVIASGYSLHGQARKAMKSGAAGYVGKPYEVFDLLESVRTVLDRKS